jgi:hypothetical protein
MIYSHNVEEGVMRIISLFELFLAVFTLYAIYEGGMKVLVPALCLVPVFIFEKLKAKLKEDEEFRKRALNHYPHSTSDTV